MSYSITIKKRAVKALTNLPNKDYQKIRDKIRKLSEDPRPTGCLKLTGRDGWRIRVGVYRIIYTIDDPDKKIIVIHIGHRRDIYQ